MRHSRVASRVRTKGNDGGIFTSCCEPPCCCRLLSHRVIHTNTANCRRRRRSKTRVLLAAAAAAAAAVSLFYARITQCCNAQHSRRLCTVQYSSTMCFNCTSSTQVVAQLSSRSSSFINVQVHNKSRHYLDLDLYYCALLLLLLYTLFRSA